MTKPTTHAKLQRFQKNIVKIRHYKIKHRKCIYLLKAFSPSTAQGRFRAYHRFKYHIVEYDTKHAHYTNIKHNPKVSPFGIALVKKWQIKLDARTIDRFDLEFQYQNKTT